MAINYRLNSDTSLEGEIQQAQGARYVSDILKQMQADGIKVDAEVYRRVRDKLMAASAAEQEAYKQNYNEGSKVQLGGMVRGLSFNPADISAGLVQQQLGVKQQRQPQPLRVLDDIDPSEAGEYARRMRGIRDGEIKVDESSPVAQVADTLVRNLTQVNLPYVGGRITTGVERDPTTNPTGQQTAETVAGLLGMGGNVAAQAAIFKGVGLGAAAPSAAMGANMAFQEGRSGLIGRGLGFAEGATLGTVVAGVGAIKSAALLKLVGETGSSRIAMETFLKSTPHQLMSAGELGAGFTALEAMREGRLPDPIEMAEGYLAFALSHSVSSGIKSLTPAGRLERATASAMREFVKSDEGIPIRELYAKGDPRVYFLAYGQKMAEIRKGLQKSIDPKAASEAAVEDYVAVTKAAVAEGRGELPGTPEFSKAAEAVPTPEVKPEPVATKSFVPPSEPQPMEIIKPVRTPTVLEMGTRPIEPQDAPVLLDTPSPTTSEVIAKLRPAEVLPTDEWSGAAQALSSGALTPWEARAQRMAESEANRQALASKTEAARTTDRPADKEPPLTASRIVEIANMEGGVERLAQMGVERIDILRAVNEVKQQERGLTDDVIGMGLGGGATQFRDAMGLSARSVVKAFDFLGDVVNFANRPGDKIADGLNRVYWKNLGRPMTERISATQAYLTEVFPPGKAAAAKWAAIAAHVAPLRWGPVAKIREIKNEFSSMTDDFNAVSLVANNNSALLREMEVKGVKELKDLYKVDDPTAYEILKIVYEYGDRGPSGRREGVEVLREVLAQNAESKWLTDRLRSNVETAIRAIEGYESLPLEVRLTVEAMNDFAQRMERDMKNTGLSGDKFADSIHDTYDSALRRKYAASMERPEFNWFLRGAGDGKWEVAGSVGARRGGLRYWPGYMTRDVTGKLYKPIQTQTAKSTNTPATMEREFRGGSIERLLVDGRAPATNSLSEALGVMHRATYRPMVARRTAEQLTGYEIEGMPAAIRQSIADKTKIETGKDQFKDYAPVQGFSLKNADGSTDTLLLHPEMQRVAGNLFETGYKGWAIKLNSAMKLAKLTLSPFHFWALSMNAVAYGVNPVDAWKNHKEVTNSAEARRLVRAGLTTDSSDVHLSGWGYQAVYGSESTGTGKLWSRGRRQAARVEQYFQRKLWDELYRTTKITSALMAERAYLEMGLSPAQATENAVISVNALHGGLNYQRWGMSVRAKQIASMFMLAPDWTISNSMWSIGLLNPLGSVGGVERKALARYAATAYVMGNMMNYMLSGHFMWENDEKYRHMVQMNIGGETRYLDPWGHMTETFKVIVGFINALNPGEDILKGTALEGSDPARYMVGKTAPLPSAIVAFGSGQTRYPQGYALPTVGDLLNGDSTGKWGGHTYQTDAWLIEAAKMGFNISAVNTFNSAIDNGWDFYKDPKFATGIFGRKVYAPYESESTESSRPSKPQRPRR